MSKDAVLNLHFQHFLNKVLPIFLVSLLLLNGCQPKPPVQQIMEIKQRGVLKVGTIYGTSSYYISGSGPAGFEYELAKSFADYLGVSLEVYPSHSLSDLLPRLKQRQVDFIAAGLHKTDARQEQFRFAPTYMAASQKLIFKQDHTQRPSDISELTGKLMVMGNSSHAENLAALKSDYPQLTWQETEEHDIEELLQMVLDEEIEYTIVDSIQLAVARRRHPELSIGFTIKPKEDIGWAINQSQDDSLYAALIEFFGKEFQNGELLALEDKYFGHVKQFNYVDTRLFIEATKEDLPQYQPWFEQYAQDMDWKLLAALSYQESHWNPRAKSPTGVRGIMMLTQPTAKQVGVTNRLDAEQNIRGGAKYLARLLKQIPDRIDDPDRTWFALASYNIGWGHIQDARNITRQQGGNPDKWIDVRKRLPLLQKKKFYKNTRYGYARGREAVTYVANIRRYYDTLVWLQDKKPNHPNFADNENQTLIQNNSAKQSVTSSTIETVVH